MAIYKVIGIGEDKTFQDESSYFAAIGYIFGHACYKGGMNINCLSSAAEEMLEHSKSCGKNSGRRIRHSVLSFEDHDGITAVEADKLAKAIILYYENYQIVYAVHNDVYNVHIHFIMNQVDLNGARYTGRKEDYYNFKEWIQMVTNRKVLLMR